MIEFGKKRTKCSLQGDGREEKALEFEVSHTRPYNPHVYELNIANAETD